MKLYFYITLLEEILWIHWNKSKAESSFLVKLWKTSRYTVLLLWGEWLWLQKTTEDINEIKRIVDLPVIGIIKRDYDGSEVFITATEKEVEELLETQAEIIALDATSRKRPTEKTTAELVQMIHEHGRLAMADISTFEEALQAQEDGFDLLSTTLAGYTEYSRKTQTPDFDLLNQIIEQVNIPVIMEGHTDSPEQVEKAYELGAFSVVVGSIITRPQLITKRYVEAASKANN